MPVVAEVLAAKASCTLFSLLLNSTVLTVLQVLLLLQSSQLAALISCLTKSTWLA